MDELDPSRYGLFQLSRREYSIDVQPSWHYFAFFRLLMISPSYWLAHEAEQGCDVRNAPSNFQAVCQTYRLFGAVWNVPFWEWWLGTAQFAFGERQRSVVQFLGSSQERENLSARDLGELLDAVTNYYGGDILAHGLPPTMLLSVPTTGDKKDILSQVEALLNKNSRVSAFIQENAAFRIRKTKTHRKTLDAAIRCVQARAYYPTEPLHEIGVRALISGEVQADIERQARGQNLKHPLVDPKREMASLVSRHIRRAYLWAENAARGIFPSREIPPANSNWPSLDYRNIHLLLNHYAEVSAIALSEIPNANRTSEARYAGRNRKLFGKSTQ